MKKLRQVLRGAASCTLIGATAAGCSDAESRPPQERAVVEAMGAGEGHACFLLSDGRVFCFGANESGQLGLGHTRALDPRAEPFVAVDLGTDHVATQIAVGPQFSCALLDDATIKCWGENGSGQLGRGDRMDRGVAAGEMGDALSPVRDTMGQVVQARFVAAGQGTACAIRLDDAVTCWGNNTYGQLGPGRAEIDILAPDATIDVGSGAVPTAIEIGGPGAAHVCVQLGGAKAGLKCWGYNGLGGLGLGNNMPLDPAQIGDAMPWVDLGSEFGAPDASTIAEVALGHRSSCARSASGVVKCWGYGFYGLGSGNDDLGNEAMEMGDLLPAVPLPRPAVRLFAGGYHFCAVLNDSTVTCWGRNTEGQLGVDAADNRGDEPGEPLGAALASSAALGAADELSTCAVEGGGTRIACWGGGALGAGLGDAAGEMGSLTPFETP